FTVGMEHHFHANSGWIGEKLVQAAAAVLVFSGGLAVAGSFRGEPLPAQAAEAAARPAATPRQAPMFAEADTAMKGFGACLRRGSVRDWRSLK
ncbi:hypothetical protein AB0K48_38890, partial [Nonomuraea sp. NPDC055795]